MLYYCIIPSALYVAFTLHILTNPDSTSSTWCMLTWSIQHLQGQPQSLLLFNIYCIVVLHTYPRPYLPPNPSVLYIHTPYTLCSHLPPLPPLPTPSRSYLRMFSLTMRSPTCWRPRQRGRPVVYREWAGFGHYSAISF